MKIFKNKQLNAESYSVFSIKSKNKRHRCTEFDFSYFLSPRFDMACYDCLNIFIMSGLLDNVLSDYLWAKAILLTSTTVATAGLAIQVPLAAVVDSLTGHAPNLMDYIGAAAVMVGFAGINIPVDDFCRSKEAGIELEKENICSADPDNTLSIRQGTAIS